MSRLTKQVKRNFLADITISRTNECLTNAPKRARRRKNVNNVFLFIMTFL